MHPHLRSAALVALLSMCAVLARPAAAECTSYTSPTGYVYNLGPLAASTFTVADSDYTYTFGICSAVTCPGKNDSAVCQTAPDLTKSLGQLSTANVTEIVEGEAVELLYTGGSGCSDGSERVTRISVVCDHHGSNTDPTVHFVGETSHCFYQFMVLAPAGCPVNGPPSPPAPPPFPPPVPHPPAPPPESNACTESMFSTGTSTYSIRRLQDKEWTGHALFNGLDNTITAQLCGTVECNQPSGIYPAVCGQNTLNSVYNIFGLVEASEFVASSLGDTRGFSVVYSSGNPCPSGEGTLSAVLDLVCSTKDTDALAITAVEPCFIAMKVESPLACPLDVAPPPPSPPPSPPSPPSPPPPHVAPFPGPHKGKLSGGSVAAIVIVLLLVLAGAGAAAFYLYSRTAGRNYASLN